MRGSYSSIDDALGGWSGTGEGRSAVGAGSETVLGLESDERRGVVLLGSSRFYEEGSGRLHCLFVRGEGDGVLVVCLQ